MKNSLEILFGSPARWRVIKLFLHNEGLKLTTAEVTKRTKATGREIKTLLEQFLKAGFLTFDPAKGRGTYRLYYLNPEFQLLKELRNLVKRSNIFPECESLQRVQKLGEVKLAVIGGVFLENVKAKTDLLVVGQDISQARLRQLLEDLEAEMGKEVNYSLMELDEFRYRVNMFDKFIMEIFNSPHEILVNKIPAETQNLDRRKDT